MKRQEENELQFDSYINFCYYYYFYCITTQIKTCHVTASFLLCSDSVSRATARVSGL